jgi:hypothetical protein
LDAVAHNDPHLNTVVKLVDLRFNADKEQYEVQSKWRGFDYEDPTWEPLSAMQENIPDMLKKFLDFFPNQGLVSAALSTV